MKFINLSLLILVLCLSQVFTSLSEKRMKAYSNLKKTISKHKLSSLPFSKSKDETKALTNDQVKTMEEATELLTKGSVNKPKIGELTVAEKSHADIIFTTMRFSVDYVYQHNTASVLSKSEDNDLVEKVFFLKDIGAQKVMLVKYKLSGVIAVVFRGTFGLMNVFTDLNISEKEWSPNSGHIFHEGFYNAYFGSIKTQLRKELPIFISQFKGKITKIIFTGHSLGAAIATVALFDCLDNKQIITNGIKLDLITYGSPRVCNKAAAMKINSDSNLDVKLRFMNQQDLFTQVPGDPYFHVGVGILYIYNRKQKFYAFPLNTDPHFKSLDNPTTVSSNRNIVTKTAVVVADLTKTIAKTLWRGMTEHNEHQDEKNIILKLVDHFLYTIHKTDWYTMMKLYYGVVKEIETSSSSVPPKAVAVKPKRYRRNKNDKNLKRN